MAGVETALAGLKTSVAYKVFVTGMALAAANMILGRLNLLPKPLNPKDVHGCFVPPPGELDKPIQPMVNLRAGNFMFIFHEGRLFEVMNTKTNIEEVERYRAWAKMNSLVDSNGAYRLATQWLSRVFVNVPRLNENYNVSVGQPSFWATPPTNWEGQGSDLTKLPLYYVTWSKNGQEAAKVGVFGPTKQLMGLTIDDPSICGHTYLLVTNQRELVNMSGVARPLTASNAELFHLFVPSSSPGKTERR